MSKEAMTLALEALYSMKETLAEHDEPTTFNEDEAIKALEEALAKQEQRSDSEQLGEPVADVLIDHEDEDGHAVLWLRDYALKNGRHLLYTAPPQSFTYEQVKAHIRAASMSANDISVGSDVTNDGVSIVIRRRDEILYAEFFAYTTPEQRTWVGLTDEEIDELHGSPMKLENSGKLKWVRIVEAKLREKNT